MPQLELLSADTVQSLSSGRDDEYRVRQLAAWARVNGLDPERIPREAVFAIRRDLIGTNSTITVGAWVMESRRVIKRDQDGQPIIEALTVPLQVEPEVYLGSDTPE